jgi:hypothetical protein
LLSLICALFRDRRSPSKWIPRFGFSFLRRDHLLFNPAAFERAEYIGENTLQYRFQSRDIEDAAERRGAPRVDEESTGTTMRDYLRGTDFITRIPEEIVMLYDDNTAKGDKVYQANQGA